jgi:hypothetical protein
MLTINKKNELIKLIRHVKFGGPGSGRNPEGGNNENDAIVKSIEDKIANNPKESGHILFEGKEIVQFEGDEDKIIIDKKKFDENTKGLDKSKIVFTHNHPSTGGSFSGSDILAHHSLGVGEMRAVDKDYNYSFKMDNNLTRNEVKGMASYWQNNMNKKAQEYFKKGATKETFLKEGSHEVLLGIAKKYKDKGVIYERSNRN